MFASLVVSFALAQHVTPRGPRAPATTDGVPACTDPLKPSANLPRRIGEIIRYTVDVSGISLGTIDFKIERRGAYEGQAVTEYRTVFKLDGLVATFIPVEGRAATLVPETQGAPMMAMNRYKLAGIDFEETQTFSNNGTHAEGKRKKNGVETSDERVFPGPSSDFIAAFYMLRSLPREVSGCTIIYGNQRAYTVWIKHTGLEQIKTPVGYKETDRYALTYVSDKGKKKAEGTIWLGALPDRLPYRAVVQGPHELSAEVQLFEKGRP